MANVLGAGNVTGSAHQLLSKVPSLAKPLKQRYVREAVGVKEDKGGGLKLMNIKAGSMGFAGNGKMNSSERCFSFQMYYILHILAACTYLTHKMHSFHTY